jgi:queuosine biosynthesis protein QueD
MTRASGIQKAILQTDGGSRGNPGPSGIGFTLSAKAGGQTICEGGAYIGKATNNQAEYRAMIWGLQNALTAGVRSIEIQADSELLVRQIKGVYRVKNERIKPLYAQVRQLLSQFDVYQIKHVYRENNSQADALANQAMDKRAAVGNYATAFSTGELWSASDFSATPATASATTPATVTATAPATAPATTPPAAAAATATPTTTPTTPTATPAPQAAGHRAGSNRATNPVLSTSEIIFEKGKQMNENSTSRVAGTATSVAAVAGVAAAAGTGIYTLTVKDHFDAAHALIGYPGQCRNLHGHTWDVEVSVSGSELDEVGIVYDFKDLKDDLHNILDSYDHKYLNEVAPFDAFNATAENLARVVYERLEATLPDHIWLEEVAVWESPIARLGYRKAK